MFSRSRALFIQCCLLAILMVFAACNNPTPPPSNNSPAPSSSSSNADKPTTATPEAASPGASTQPASTDTGSTPSSPTNAPDASVATGPKNNSAGPPTNLLDQNPKAPHLAPKPGQSFKPAAPAECGNHPMLCRYYVYLLKNGLKLNPPKEFPPFLIGAVDTIQFTTESKAAVLVAQYAGKVEQDRADEAVNRFTKDGRQLFKIGNYTLIVKNGDDQLNRALTAALENFEKKA